ncbi:hypothetical protein [Microbispora sp. NPDC049125]|uniref:hypothetical protein n=1 Tax=Microbispora sp. NPDC049125 TaxID=3154929 RepID=UPI003466D5DA
MPVCTALFAAALLTGPAAPPDPAPPAYQAVAPKVDKQPTVNQEGVARPNLAARPATVGTNPASGQGAVSPAPPSTRQTAGVPDGAVAAPFVRPVDMPADKAAGTVAGEQAPAQQRAPEQAAGTAKAPVKAPGQAPVKAPGQAAGTVKAPGQASLPDMTPGKALAPGQAPGGAEAVPGEKAAAKKDTSDVMGVPMIDPTTHDMVIRPVFAETKPGQPPKPFTLPPLKGVQVAKAAHSYGPHQAAPRPRQHSGARGGR